MSHFSRRRFLTHVSALAVATHVLRGRASAQATGMTRTGDRLETVAPGQLPSFAAKASPRAREAYRYAAANDETLQYIPCFCGCTDIGHRHNGDCYVTERHADGRITFNSHAVT